jgi:hypothetical protein
VDVERYDVVSLNSTEYVASALADRDLARRVAEHKTMFFRERDGRGDVIDYGAAVMGALQLAPNGPAEELLAADYAGMVNDGLLFERAPIFAELLAQPGDDTSGRGGRAGVSAAAGRPADHASDLAERINPDAIARAMTESLRQQFVQSGLPATADALTAIAQQMNEATGHVHLSEFEN